MAAVGDPNSSRASHCSFALFSLSPLSLWMSLTCRILLCEHLSQRRFGGLHIVLGRQLLPLRQLRGNLRRGREQSAGECRGQRGEEGRVRVDTLDDHWSDSRSSSRGGRRRSSSISRSSASSSSGDGGWSAHGGMAACGFAVQRGQSVGTCAGLKRRIVARSREAGTVANLGESTSKRKTRGKQPRIEQNFRILSGLNYSTLQSC